MSVTADPSGRRRTGPIHCWREIFQPNLAVSNNLPPWLMRTN